MSGWAWTNSGWRVCSVVRWEPVSKLSTQMTRCPRRSSSSHRCEPRNPAPPVTRQVAMAPQAIDARRRFALRPRSRHTFVADPARHTLGIEVLEQRLGVAATGPQLVTQPGQRDRPLPSHERDDARADLREHVDVVRERPDPLRLARVAQLREQLLLVLVQG